MARTQEPQQGIFDVEHTTHDTDIPGVHLVARTTTVQLGPLVWRRRSPVRLEVDAAGSNGNGRHPGRIALGIGAAAVAATALGAFLLSKASIENGEGGKKGD